MYIRTPKRYQGTQRRQVLSCRRLFVSLIMVVIIITGIGIYQNRELFQPTINLLAATIVSDFESRAATQIAPPPTATQDPTVNLVNGNNAWERGNVSEAVTYYQQIINSVPNDVIIHQRLTLGLLTRGDKQAALDYAERTVTADPFSPEAWATRALIMSWEDNYEQGIASALQALDFGEDNPQALAFLAYSYWGAGKVELAESRVNEAISLNPDSYEGYWVRGLIRENSLLDIEGALSDFERAYQLALEQNPPMAGVAAAGIARILVRPEYGDYDRAVTLLEQMRSADPDNRDVLYTLGIVQYTYRGDYGQAQGPLEECTRVAPHDYDCYYLLGRTYDRLDNTEAALAAFEAAIEAGSPWARHYWWAANTYIVQGKCPEAVSLLRTGYRMVQPGDLPANDEGAEDLLNDAFPALMTTCRVPFADSSLTPTPTSDPAQEG